MVNWESFFALPSNATIWDALNSPILVAFIAAAIGWILNGRVKKAEEKADDAVDLLNLKEKVEITQSEKEDEPAGSAPLDDPNRPQAKALFDEADAFVRGVMKNDRDGRHQRTYKTIDGASLPIKAAALRERELFSESQYEAAVRLTQEWNKYRRGRAANKVVPSSTIELMRSALLALKLQS